MTGQTAMAPALLAWSARCRRDLPWRRTRDPWAVLVSELMLQQTQVSRVVPRYAAFLRSFPSPAACAHRPLGDVVRAWSGLGYNRRAVNLHRAAAIVVDRHGGRLPDDLEALRALPGVGAYTARAVLAFGFERDVGVVDTNAGRVLARTAGQALTAAQAQDLATSLVPRGQGWAWNQAVLDLGAMVCTRRAPKCAQCPLTAQCRWRARDCSAPDPADGSASVSGGQSRFAGSDREGRGRLVDAMRRGPVPLGEVAGVAGWPGDPARADRVLASLLGEGLAVQQDGWVALP